MTSSRNALALAAAVLAVAAISEARAQGAPAAQAPVASATTRMAEPPGPPIPLGPYADVTIEAAFGLPTHTVYHPTDLSAFPSRDKLPIVVWGNGACSPDGLYFQGFKTKIASHGFVMVVAGRKDQRDRPDAAARATGPQLVEAIDWAINENTRAGSPLRGKIDTGSVAMMGMSCGGLMAIESAHDPRVDTLVIWNSGVFNNPAADTRSLSPTTKATLATIHSNTAYFNGGVTDIAYENSNDDVSRINQVPLFYGVMKDAGHGATFRHKNGGKFGEVGANWLMWRLKGDTRAAAMFDGPECGLCKDPQWVVQKKKMR